MTSTSRPTRGGATALYNLFNTNDATGYEDDFGDGSTWLVPTNIVQPRFVRLNVTVTF